MDSFSYPHATDPKPGLYALSVELIELFRKKPELIEDFMRHLRDMERSNYTSVPTPTTILPSVPLRNPGRIANPISLTGFWRNTATSIPLPPPETPVSPPQAATTAPSASSNSEGTLWALILEQLDTLPYAEQDAIQLQTSLLYLYPPKEDPDPLIASLSLRKYI